MREIKLRGWNKKHKYMEYWDALNEFDGHLYCVVNDCKPYIMQYTGLKDKNGVEIYEGDILNCDNVYKGVVAWNTKCSSFCLDVDGEKSDHLYGAEFTSVVGNIYENPELLEAS